MASSAHVNSETSTSHAGSGASRRHTFTLSLAALLLIQTAWALTLPMFRGPDEIDHLLRASNVALGHWQPTDQPTAGGPSLRARGWLADAASPTCLTLREKLNPEFCAPTGTHSDGTVDIRSGAALYNPTYYGLVGLPLRVSSGLPALWMVRALGALLSALLIACAFTITSSGRRTAWPTAALFVALTPAVFFATVVAAPNGLGFAGALLLWSGLLSSLRTESHRTAALCATVVGGMTLTLTHSMSPIWLVATLAAALVAAGGLQIRRLVKERPWACLATASSLVTGLLIAAWWTVYFSPNAPGPAEPLVAETKSIGMAAHVVLWIFQMIGVMPNRFGVLWPLIYALWAVPLLILIMAGIRVGASRHRRALVVVAVVSIVVPTIATLLTFDSMGVAWQGRYGLPLLFGMVLVAGEALDDADVALRATPRVIGTALIATAQFLSLLCFGLRESRGAFADGRPWALLLWVVVPTLVAVAYCLMLAASNRRNSVQAQRES